MIPNTDTIIDPRTMMVHLDDTSLTDTAMMGPVGFVRLAASTNPLDRGGARWRTGWRFQQVVLQGQWMIRIGTSSITTPTIVLGGSIGSVIFVITNIIIIGVVGCSSSGCGNRDGWILCRRIVRIGDVQDGLGIGWDRSRIRRHGIPVRYHGETSHARKG